MSNSWGYLDEQGSEADISIRRKLMFDTAVKLCKDSSSILNLGAGYNLHFEKIVLRSDVEKIIKVDMYGRNLPKEPPGIKFMDGNIERNDFYAENFDHKSFDTIVIFDVLEHIVEIDLVLENSYKILKNNGNLIISIPNLASITNRLNLMIGYQPPSVEISDIYPMSGMGLLGKMNYRQNAQSIHHIRGITSRALLELLKNHGFQITKTFGFSFLPFWPKRAINACQLLLVEARKS